MLRLSEMQREKCAIRINEQAEELNALKDRILCLTEKLERKKESKMVTLAQKEIQL